MQKLARFLDNYFHISSLGSSFAIEMRAGLTTFLTMAYILVVNPSILSQAINVPDVELFPQLFTATALMVIVGTALMGIIAKYPFAVAPGMGINAFFTYSLIMGKGVPWQTALGAVLIAGILFILITALGIREKIVSAIPLSLKKAMAGGIGMFLAYLGLMHSGILVADKDMLVGLGNLTHALPLLACSGLLITAILLALNVRGAILIGILAVTLLGIIFNVPIFNGHVFQGFTNGIVSLPVMPKDLLGAFDLKGALSVGMMGAVFSFLFVSFFDTAGTLLGLAEKAGFTDTQGNVPRASKAFMVDALATTFSGIIGTSPATCYIESAAGIEEGGRTGFTAVTIAALFVAAMFFWPVVAVIPTIATAPALIIVGAMMMTSVATIDWHDYRTSIPAFLTIILMPLTHSITNGIAFGIISYTVIHSSTFQAKRLHPIMWLLSVLLTGMLILN